MLYIHNIMLVINNNKLEITNIMLLIINKKLLLTNISNGGKKYER